MAEYINREVAIAKLTVLEVSEPNATMVDAKRQLANMPAADVAPVRHGHWDTGYFHDRVCSCCLHPDNDIDDYAHSYCPNCGATMDEGDNDAKSM